MASRKRVGLLMKKVGNSAVFDARGMRVPVTLLHLENTFVVALKTKDECGYDAVVFGVGCVGNLKKPQVRYLRQRGVGVDCKLFESRVDVLGDVGIGSRVLVSHFVVGQWVDVSGCSVGKGFAGTIKRHNFGGMKASHGVSISHRSQGSTGQCQDPGRVFKGKKMAGHMGSRRVTMQNLKVLLVEEERALLVVEGANIPGARGSYVFVRDAVKKPVPRGLPSLVAVVPNQGA